MLYHGETLSLEWLEDGIAALVFSAPGPVNKLDMQTLASLSNAISVLEKLPALRGLLLRSDKPAFIVGADITEFLSLFSAPPATLSHWLNDVNQLFNRLEDLPVPTVSAINGYALGGGCECVLATDYRVAAHDVRIGLPETRLGIMPGFGGTVRLPRLLGADSAMEIIAAGKDVNAEQAMKLGLVDAVVSAEKLHAQALLTLKEAITHPQNWQLRREQKRGPLRMSRTEAQMSFSTAKAMVIQTSGKHYPAPMAAIKTIEAAASKGRDEALKLETAAFVPLAQSDEAHALTGIFLNDKAVKAKAARAAGTAPKPKKIAVLGAGIMGGGIALLAASRGTPTLLKDISEKALMIGMDEATALLHKQRLRGKIDDIKMASVVSRIQPTLHFSEFDQVDIVVEAVVEDPAIKKAVLADVETRLHPAALLTSNTSTIPVNELASALARPERFCGMHFFNPVHRMPLVEIIRGEKTAESTLASVVVWASSMGKVPIIVNDCPGFFVNRVLFPYFSGFSLLLRDGADFRKVDRAMENYGWPMGPSKLLDVVGIDTAHHAQRVMASGFPQRMSKDYSDAIDQLFDAGRFGQKTQRGFWQWTPDSKGKLTSTDDPAVDRLLQEVCQPLRDFSEQEIVLRMMIPMVNEVVRCLEEGIVASPAEADMALVYGLGFPPFRGGVFRYLDAVGSSRFVERAETFASLGSLYPLPDLLRRKAGKSEHWYPQQTSPTGLKLPIA